MRAKGVQIASKVLPYTDAPIQSPKASISPSPESIIMQQEKLSCRNLHGMVAFTMSMELHVFEQSSILPKLGSLLRARICASALGCHQNLNHRPVCKHAKVNCKQ